MRPVAISVDEPDVSRNLCSKAAYTFTFLSDPNTDAIRRYDGSIRESDRQWSFRFWREDQTAERLPLRIEFQPKPMLRLSLELAVARTT